MRCAVKTSERVSRIQNSEECTKTGSPTRGATEREVGGYSSSGMCVSQKTEEQQESHDVDYEDQRFRYIHVFAPSNVDQTSEYLHANCRGECYPGVILAGV